MNWLWSSIKSEPVAAQWVLQCAMNVAVNFGLHLTTPQRFAVLTFTAAVLAFMTRQSVQPLHKAS